MDGAVAVIPARYASTRFPGKPLVPLLGRPMLLWVADLCAEAGAWLQEPGTAYVRVSAGLLSTRERFDADQRRMRPRNSR